MNGLVKRHFRTTRAASLASAFHAWKFKCLQAQQAKLPLPPFVPSKVSLLEGLRTVMAMFNGNGLFTTPEFKAALRQGFVDCGYARTPMGKWRQYAGTARSHSHQRRLLEWCDQFCAADFIGVGVQTRQPAPDRSDAAGGEESESSSSEEEDRDE